VSRSCHALPIGFGRRSAQEEIIVQPATLDHRNITALRERRGFGEHDLWELWLLDEAEEVPCGSVRTFLNYLCSKGTTHCEINQEASPLYATGGGGSVDIRLMGPIADDERNHYLRYRLTRGNVGELREAEKDLLISRLIEHYSPIKEGFYGLGRLARMKHEKEALLTSLIASAFDHEEGGNPND
jgi:hypothetical protein